MTLAWGLEEVPGPNRSFQALDVFELEWASDPQISPDGERVAYVRNSMDIMADRVRSDIWLVSFDGEDHRPITTSGLERSPRWSPDGERLLYVSSNQGSTQIYARWLDSGQTARLTHLTRSPSDLVWSPDGSQIALSVFVPAEEPPFAEMPRRPEGAQWADPPKVIENLEYRADGSGYLEQGSEQLFVLPADGGTPRQLTFGDFELVSPPCWSNDGQALLFSANRHENRLFDPLNSEIYELSLVDGSLTALTERSGPDRSPILSPDGQHIAYLGFDDRRQGFQLTRLYLMNRDGSDGRVLTTSLDRSIQAPSWGSDGEGVYFRFTNEGRGSLGFVSLDGQVRTLADDLGTSIGRPYSGGAFSVAEGGRFAYTLMRSDRPADIGVGDSESLDRRQVTRLNEDLLAHKDLAEVEEIWFESSYDGRRIQGWVAKPAGFDDNEKYPLILEIHGGPFAAYGPNFSAEIQLYAAAGYVVLYTNPRGSTSYGEQFGNLIHHNYPGQDYDDLMSGVTALIDQGTIDESQLYVTGGSGGGVLTAWIVGKTDRFRAAVAAKPVINWTSWALTADNYNFYYQYWFPGPPWDHPEEYRRRSPLFLVGNVKTPTMLLTGEEDYRTPMSESEQYYQALKLRQVDTALVRIPGASHGIANRPSHLIAKVNHILAWFERYRDAEETSTD